MTIPKLPTRFEPLLFALLLSGLMSLLVSGVATWSAVGLYAGFSRQWLMSWLSSWGVAFPAVMVIAPWVRKVVARMIVLED